MLRVVKVPIYKNYAKMGDPESPPCAAGYPCETPPPHQSLLVAMSAAKVATAVQAFSEEYSGTDARAKRLVFVVSTALFARPPRQDH